MLLVGHSTWVRSLWRVPGILGYRYRSLPGPYLLGACGLNFPSPKPNGYEPINGYAPIKLRCQPLTAALRVCFIYSLFIPFFLCHRSSHTRPLPGSLVQIAEHAVEVDAGSHATEQEQDRESNRNHSHSVPRFSGSTARRNTKCKARRNAINHSVAAEILAERVGLRPGSLWIVMKLDNALRKLLGEIAIAHYSRRLPSRNGRSGMRPLSGSTANQLVPYPYPSLM